MAIYYVVLLATDINFALITILMGMDGRQGCPQGIREGQAAAGFTRAVAVFLTYNAIVLTYNKLLALFVHAEGSEGPAGRHQARAGGSETGSRCGARGSAGGCPRSRRVPVPAALVMLVVLLATLYAASFLAGAENIIGMLIIIFGLYQAWVLNRRVPILIEGPYQLGAAPARPSEAADVDPGT